MTTNYRKIHSKYLFENQLYVGSNQVRRNMCENMQTDVKSTKIHMLFDKNTSCVKSLKQKFGKGKLFLWDLERTVLCEANTEWGVGAVVSSNKTGEKD